MKMKKLFVSSLLTAMAVPVMMFAQAPAPSTDTTKPTTKSTTKAKKTHAKKTTAAPASASNTKTASPAPKN
jgi:hypothetical protein